VRGGKAGEESLGCEILFSCSVRNFADSRWEMRAQLTADGRGGQAATEDGSDSSAARNGRGGALQKHGGVVSIDCRFGDVVR